MEKKATLILSDAVNCKFVGLDPITRKKFNDALKFMVPNAQFSPQFRLKRWDGMMSFGGLGGTTFINLLELVLPLVMNAGYEIEINDKRPVINFSFPEIDEDYIADRVWPPGHVKAGEHIFLRDYQVDAINRFFENPQSLQRISTAAGKTVLTACLSLAIEANGRSIVIVPSKDLVKQTEADYRNIGLDVGVYYGDRKEWDRTHTICTWQSLCKFAKSDKVGETSFKKFLEGVVCVIVDEAHTIKGTELKELLGGAMSGIPLRWGLTGTIPKDEFEFMALLSTIGPVVGEIRAQDLQEKGVLANCRIDVMQLRDDHVEFSDYSTEHEFLLGDPDRLAWIARYTEGLSLEGNTLVLVDRIETGKILARLIPGSVFVSGDTKSEARKREYDEIQTADNKIIIATYGVASVGINIPRLFNCVLVECGRSFVRTIQSIGRVLRKAHDKDMAVVTDITSTLKFSKRHLSKRKEYYEEAGYPFKVTKVDYRKAIL